MLARNVFYNYFIPWWGFSFLPLWANLIMAGTGIVLLILDIYDYLFKKE